MNLIYAFVIAFSMYSKIPMPRVDWTKERMRYTFCFFPMIGAVIGALMFLWEKYGRILTGENAFFTAVLILIPIVITGGIHMDGFLDTSDALSSYKTMDEKLEILKDSHAGAFAIIMGICYFVLDFGVYSAVTEEVMRVLAVGFLLSRSLSGMSVVTFKMAKKSGLAATFSDMAQKRTVGIVMGVYIVGCLIIMLTIHRILGLTAFVTAVAVFFYYRHMAYKKFGGITGDLAGFFLQVCELAMAVTTVIAANICL